MAHWPACGRIVRKRFENQRACATGWIFQTFGYKEVKAVLILFVVLAGFVFIAARFAGLLSDWAIAGSSNVCGH